ncbi:hypothetical protein DHX103_02600 [Planococcus sp. X10-3]|uniref:hypothetical protein n=1 Tax=Planococcus sp. X10-3 TaxID=3061240 RepID=UPI003BAF822C
MINRTIFGGQVFYRIADLAELFDVSAYKMRKAIKEQNIKTTRLPGFGRCVFVLEADISKINVYGEMKVLKTEFTAEPVKETKVVEIPKAKRKYKKRKSAAKTTKKAEVVELPTPAIIEEPKIEHAPLIKQLKTLRIQYAQNCICDKYDEIYGAYFDENIPDDKFTIEHDEKLKEMLKMLESELKEPVLIEELSF